MVLLDGLEAQLLLRVERREAVEVDPLPRLLGIGVVERCDIRKREVVLAVARHAGFALDRIPVPNRVVVYQLRGHEDVVTPRQVVVDPGAQEAEALGQDLQHALDPEHAVFVDL